MWVVVLHAPGIVRSSFVDIADYIYKKKAPLELSLQGIWIADRG